MPLRTIDISNLSNSAPIATGANLVYVASNASWEWITGAYTGPYTNATYSNLNITNWDFGTSGTNVTSYNSSTKIEGSHSGYISGNGNINRQPGKGQGQTPVAFSSAYCIAMWVNIAAYKPTYNVAYPWNHGGKTSSGNKFGPCGVQWGPGGTVEFCTAKYNGSAYSGISASVGSLPTDTWYHVIAAATPGGSTIKLWMSQEGGSFAGLANESGFSLSGRTDIEELVVGDGANNWYLHGSIGTLSDGASIYYDDVRIYDAVPSDAEAQAIFETNGDLTSTSNPLTSNLRFAYQFNNTRSAGIV